VPPSAWRRWVATTYVAGLVLGPCLARVCTTTFALVGASDWLNTAMPASEPTRPTAQVGAPLPMGKTSLTSSRRCRHTARCSRATPEVPSRSEPLPQPSLRTKKRRRSSWTVRHGRLSQPCWPRPLEEWSARRLSKLAPRQPLLHAHGLQTLPPDEGYSPRAPARATIPTVCPGWSRTPCHWWSGTARRFTSLVTGVRRSHGVTAAAGPIWCSRAGAVRAPRSSRGSVTEADPRSRGARGRRRGRDRRR
jgi:hypothetical protein